MCNKKIASGEVPKAYYNALYKTASPASTPKEGRKEGRKEKEGILSTASSYYTFFRFLVSSIEQKNCGTASTGIN
jgi:hypothetical protein